DSISGNNIHRAIRKVPGSGIRRHSIGEMLAPGPSPNGYHNFEIGVLHFQQEQIFEIDGIGLFVVQPGAVVLDINEGIIDM
ncbi:MAG: hypothetical protein Q8918_19630, partial [Bacteroidota bacterium]|nr:hypothetical protein [Bacteroidota bacterium]